MRSRRRSGHGPSSSSTPTVRNRRRSAGSNCARASTGSAQARADTSLAGVHERTIERGRGRGPPHQVVQQRDVLAEVERPAVHVDGHLGSARTVVDRCPRCRRGAARRLGRGCRGARSARPLRSSIGCSVPSERTATTRVACIGSGAAGAGRGHITCTAMRSSACDRSEVHTEPLGRARRRRRARRATPCSDTRSNASQAAGRAGGSPAGRSTMPRSAWRRGTRRPTGCPGSRRDSQIHGQLLASRQRVGAPLRGIEVEDRDLVTRRRFESLITTGDPERSSDQLARRGVARVPQGVRRDAGPRRRRDPATRPVARNDERRSRVRATPSYGFPR